VADRQGERVRRVGGLRHGAEPENPRDHRADLRFVRRTRPGDRRLDLRRRVQRDRQPGARRRHDRHRRGLRGAHHGAHVVLAEHAFHGHDFRPVLLDQVRQDIRDRHQPVTELGVRRSADHVHVDEPAPAARRTIHHTDPAAGEPWIDSEHAQARPPPYSCSVRSGSNHNGQPTSAMTSSETSKFA
jgi:hypothetical protein